MDYEASKLQGGGASARSEAEGVALEEVTGAMTWIVERNNR